MAVLAVYGNCKDFYQSQVDDDITTIEIPCGIWNSDDYGIIIFTTVVIAIL